MKPLSKCLTNYILFLLVAVLIEIFICNSSALNYLNSTPQDITAGMTVSNALPLDSGEYLTSEAMTLEWTSLDCAVDRLYVDISADGLIFVPAQIYVKDEGNAAAYYPISNMNSFHSAVSDSHPDMQAVQASHYTSLHPYGRVQALMIQLDVPAGTKVTVNKVTLNPHRPFLFRWERVAAIFLIMSLIYTFRKGSRLHEITLFRVDGRLGRRRILAMVLFTVLCLFVLRYLNQVIIPSEEYHDTTQYNLLAHSLAEGHTSLDIEVDSRLLGMDNPYDKSAREALGVDYPWDVAYYQGSYYSYFGIIPVLLVHLPYYLLTGQDISGVSATFVFAVLFLLAAVWLSFELLRHYSPQVPFYLWPMSVILIVFSAVMIINIQRASIYKIPSLSGNAFLCAGLAAYIHFLHGIQSVNLCAKNQNHVTALNSANAPDSQNPEQKVTSSIGNFDTGKEATTAPSDVWLFLGSLCWALMVGCRPQMGLAIILVLPLFRDVTVRERRLFSKETLSSTFVFLIPYMAVAALLMYYNYIRFGNVFDFGAAYNLTTNDMTLRGWHISRLPGGLFIYLFQLPNLVAHFPFVEPASEVTGYVGLQIAEKVYGGVLACNLICWIFAPALYLRDLFKEKKVRALILTMLGIAASICCVDISGAGILQRYQSDFGTLIIVAALILFGILLEHDKASGRMRYYALAQWGMLSILSVIIYDFCVSWQFMSQDSMVSMYHTIRTLFLF